MSRCPSVGALVAAALSLLAPAPALALTGSQSFTAAGEHSFVVPAGVTSVEALLVGGNGAPGSGGATGGTPATITASLSVIPGETLYAEVAGDGQPPTQAGDGLGGTGGGGSGGVIITLFGGVPAGGGGGGASDIRTCPSAASGCDSLSSRLVVAGGGGGGGSAGSDGVVSLPGGAGGPADISGGGGIGDGTPADTPGTAGDRGTASAGGPASTGGAAGTNGTGGAGAVGALITTGGGGGGGGIFGGGGGGTGSGHQGTGNCCISSAGGGGGGASGMPAGAHGVSGFSLMPTADGAEPRVTFTWTLPAPAVITGAPSGLTKSGATLTGTINPNNSGITDCHFVLTPAPPGHATIPCGQQVGMGGTPVSVSAPVSGLAPSTKYVVTLLAASPAGQGSGSPVQFTTPRAGPACIVPRLKGKTLASARTALTKAHCALGTVRRPRVKKGQKLGKLVVGSQSPSPGATRTSGTKIAVVMVKAPKPRKRHH